MPTSHTVQEGDSILSLADGSGLFPETIWNDGANAGLREHREDMNILLPGDVVVIPDIREKFEKRPTGKKHYFRRKGIPALFRLQIFDMNVPVANQPYTLKVQGVEKQGKTDAEGILQEFVPASATEGEIQYKDGEREVTLQVQFGYLDPLNEISGAQHRLTNLGYQCDSEFGVLNQETTDALLDFQRDNKLPLSGQIDPATKAKLEEIHDNPYRYPDPDSEAPA